MMVSRVDAAMGSAVKRVLSELVGGDEVNRLCRDGRGIDVAAVEELSIGARLSCLLFEEDGGKKDISDSGTRRILEEGERSATV